VPLVLGALLLVAALAVGLVFLSSDQARARVPDLTGLDAVVATERLERMRLTSRIRYRPDPAPRGRVLATDPPEGEAVDQGETVALVVSAGPDTTAVPAVRGVRRDAAERRLRAAGFSVEVDEVRVADAARDGLAIGTDPPAGTALAPGATVRLEVGVSPEPPPATTSGTPRTQPPPPTGGPHPTQTHLPPPPPPPPPTPDPTALPPPETAPQTTVAPNSP
jgi:beta-lactam-binding protein with PASTA domain